MVMEPQARTIAVYEMIEIRAILGSEVAIPVTVAPSETEIPTGTVLGQVTADKLFYPYDDTKSDGREVAKVILAEPVPAGEAELVATAYIKGIFYQDKLAGLDAAALADLLGREIDGIVVI